MGLVSRDCGPVKPWHKQRLYWIALRCMQVGLWTFGLYANITELCGLLDGALEVPSNSPNLWPSYCPCRFVQ